MERPRRRLGRLRVDRAAVHLGLPRPRRRLPCLGAVARGGEPARELAHARAREPPQGLPRRPGRAGRAHRGRAGGHDARPHPAAVAVIGGQARRRCRWGGGRARGAAGRPRRAHPGAPGPGRCRHPALPVRRRGAGEISVICIDGVVTHAVHKLPAAGEFRIHDHWGGTAELVDPEPAVVDIAGDAGHAAQHAALRPRRRPVRRRGPMSASSSSSSPTCTSRWPPRRPTGWPARSSAGRRSAADGSAARRRVLVPRHGARQAARYLRPMPPPSEPRLLVLHGLQLKGTAAATALAETIDLPVADVEGELRALLPRGWWSSARRRPQDGA